MALMTFYALKNHFLLLRGQDTFLETAKKNTHVRARAPSNLTLSQLGQKEAPDEFQYQNLEYRVKIPVLFLIFTSNIR